MRATPPESMASIAIPPAPSSRYFAWCSPTTRAWPTRKRPPNSGSGKPWPHGPAVSSARRVDAELGGRELAVCLQDFLQRSFVELRAAHRLEALHEFLERRFRQRQSRRHGVSAKTRDEARALRIDRRQRVPGVSRSGRRLRSGRCGPREARFTVWNRPFLTGAPTGIRTRV